MLNNTHSFLASVLRGPRGLIASPMPEKAPSEPLVLFDREICPYCRKVREAFSELDIDYIARPAAQGSSNRAEVVARGGKQMFPYLIDPNTGREMYESEDIITYLATTYHGGRPTIGKLLAPLNTAHAALPSAFRPMGDRTKGRAEQPVQLLELWQFEASPYCRKVREVLATLDLNYRVHNVAKRGAKRPGLRALGGRMMVPYLVDPNTGTAMYESDDIVAYLRETYPL